MIERKTKSQPNSERRKVVASTRSEALLFLQKRQESFVTSLFHLFGWNEMESGRENVKWGRV